MARGPDGVTWMIDDCPVTVMEVIDRIAPVMAEWAIDQTVAVLGPAPAEVGAAARETPGDAVRVVDTLEQDERVAEVAELLVEFVRFSHAVRVLAGRFEHLREVMDGERWDERGEGAGRAAA